MKMQYTIYNSIKYKLRLTIAAEVKRMLFYKHIIFSINIVMFKELLV